MPFLFGLIALDVALMVQRGDALGTRRLMTAFAPFHANPNLQSNYLPCFPQTCFALVLKGIQCRDFGSVNANLVSFPAISFRQSSQTRVTGDSQTVSLPRWSRMQLLQLQVIEQRCNRVPTGSNHSIDLLVGSMPVQYERNVPNTNCKPSGCAGQTLEIGFK